MELSSGKPGPLEQQGCVPLLSVGAGVEGAVVPGQGVLGLDLAGAWRDGEEENHFSLWTAL